MILTVNKARGTGRDEDFGQAAKTEFKSLPRLSILYNVFIYAA